MSKNAHAPLSSHPSKAQGATLAKLQRLYGRRHLTNDMFGRRPALPSEVERVVKTQQPSPKKKAERC